MASKFTITGDVIVRFWPNPHSFILGSQSSLFSQLDANHQFPTISDLASFSFTFLGDEKGLLLNRIKKPNPLTGTILLSCLLYVTKPGVALRDFKPQPTIIRLIK